MMTGLSVQRQASRLNKPAVASPITSPSATLTVTAWPLLRSGRRASARHRATLHTVAIQKLASTTTQSGRMPAVGV